MISMIIVSIIISKAFWEYNQTSSNDQLIPSPIITIDKVNLTYLTLIITACCRNVEKDLVHFQNNILSMGSSFGNYKIYLGESDSQDGTLRFLQQWALNDSKHVDIYTVQPAFRDAAVYNGKYLSEECVYNGWADQRCWRFRQ
ncbi:hypothetical protein I4U23_005512 [Adineta vaga]|nr:hypothetical protein I4U23_005512 [Adineta vaga]